MAYVFRDYSKSFPYTDFHYIDRYNMAAIPFSIPTSINEELLGDKRTGAMISQNQTDMTKLTQPVTLIILNFLSNLYIDIPKLLPWIYLLILVFKNSTICYKFSRIFFNFDILGVMGNGIEFFFFSLFFLLYLSA